MKLYRGYKERPGFLTPKLAEEYETLSVLKKRLNEENPEIQDFLRAMGVERMARWYELAKIAGSQHFTEHENVARAFAAKKGFVLKLELDDVIANEHNQGIQMMTNDEGEVMPVTNFVFSGEELSQHMKDWKFDLIDLERDKTERLGDRDDTSFSAEQTKKPNILRDRITSIEDLSPRDQRTLSELRKNFGTPKSPPTEGESTKI